MAGGFRILRSLGLNFAPKLDVQYRALAVERNPLYVWQPKRQGALDHGGMERTGAHSLIDALLPQSRAHGRVGDALHRLNLDDPNACGQSGKYGEKDDSADQQTAVFSVPLDKEGYAAFFAQS